MDDLYYFVASAILLCTLLAMRWAHRSWGKAFLSTFFAPLVAVPMYFVGIIAFGFLLRIINAPLSVAGFGMSKETLGIVAAISTAAIMLALLVHYLRDQRHLSLIETSPRLGVRQTFQPPKMGLKTRIR